MAVTVHDTDTAGPVVGCGPGNGTGNGMGCSSGIGTGGGGCGPGNGTGNGMGCNSGYGIYMGSWTGNSTNTACIDTGELALSNYCAQLRGGMVPVTLTITTGDGGTVIGFLVTGATARFSSQINPSLAANGDLILTGTPSPASNGVFTYTLTAWDSVANGNTMTGTWSMTITSPQSNGSANMQWSLTGLTHAASSSRMSFGANPVGP